jgi:hypothetical protein
VAADASVDWAGLGVTRHTLGPDLPNGEQQQSGAHVRTVLPVGLEVRDALTGGRIVRVLTGLRAGVEVRVGLPDYREAFATGLAFDGGIVRSGHGIHFSLDVGERALVTIEADGAKPLTLDAALRLLDDARRVPPVFFEGPFPDVVEQSLNVLRLLTYEPTGGLRSSPADDLVRLADHVEAMGAFRACGWVEDAELASSWLVRALLDHDFPMPPLFDLEGRPESEEREWRVWAEPELLDHEELWPVVRRAAAWLADAWPEAPDDDARIAAHRALDRIGRRAQSRNPLDLDAVTWRMEAKEAEPPETPPPTPNPDPDAVLDVAELARDERWEAAHERMEGMAAAAAGSTGFEARTYLDLVAAAGVLATGPR